MNLDIQAPLAYGRVRLRPLQPDDFEALYAVAADPLLWEQHPAHNRYERGVFEVFFQEALASGGAYLVLDAATGGVIGSSRYYTRYGDYTAPEGQVCIGYTFLSRRCWGNTFNKDLKQAMLGHAFAAGADAVVFHVGPQNERSRRAVEKLGAKLTAEGHPSGSLTYRLRRAAWPG